MPKAKVRKFQVPTLLDVARHARVSTATASRVLNGSATESPPVRERVEDAARVLGYTPNRIATSLRQQYTQTVGLLVPDITNPFFASVAKAAERTLRGAGYSCMLCDTEGGVASEQHDAMVCLHRRVDGMLVISNDSTASFFEKLGQQGQPIVLVDRPSSRWQGGDEGGGERGDHRSSDTLPRFHQSALASPPCGRPEALRRSRDLQHVKRSDALDCLMWGESPREEGLLPGSPPDREGEP